MHAVWTYNNIIATGVHDDIIAVSMMSSALDYNCHGQVRILNYRC